MKIGDQFVILVDQLGAPVGTVVTVEGFADNGSYLYSWDGIADWRADSECVAQVDFDVSNVKPGDQVVIFHNEGAAPVGEIVTVDKIQNGDLVYTWQETSGWVTGAGACAKILR